MEGAALLFHPRILAGFGEAHGFRKPETEGLFGRFPGNANLLIGIFGILGGANREIGVPRDSSLGRLVGRRLAGLGMTWIDQASV
jgi:hypothetical protein